LDYFFKVVDTEIQPDRFAAGRQNMVDSQLRARGIRDERVLAVMARVPRHEFVPERFQDRAYEDHPIPISEGQTISQPYIVAFMLESLSLERNSKVLEVGTGSGYQTALLAELSGHVSSIERFPRLAQEAQSTLARFGYSNVDVIVGDGSIGLPDAAPFDAIIVAAAAPRVPSSLFNQLGENGRMVIPVGPADAQELLLVQKWQGQPMTQRLEGCRFVPLIGVQGYPA
jgi:protein-L-isoaspartate(D-aspartate) O-methyltransferase